MARMTHFHQILKRDLFKRIVFLRTFLSAEDILAAWAKTKYPSSALCTYALCTCILFLDFACPAG